MVAVTSGTRYVRQKFALEDTVTRRTHLRGEPAKEAATAIFARGRGKGIFLPTKVRARAFIFLSLSRNCAARYLCVQGTLKKRKENDTLFRIVLEEESYVFLRNWTQTHARGNEIYVEHGRACVKLVLRVVLVKLRALIRL